MKQSNSEDVRTYNVGNSDYAKHKIQVWDIWKEYQLNPWDADIVKRVLRNKSGESRKMDYEKIIHVCKERIRQLDETAADGAEEVSDDEDVDGTTVMCPGELDKPGMSQISNIRCRYERMHYTVYSVFKHNHKWYAYLGWCAERKSDVYLHITGMLNWSYTEFSGYPSLTFMMTKAIGRENHIYSVKIGSAGTDYVLYDYLINGGVMYRYFGLDPKRGQYYKRFDKDGSVNTVYAISKILNEAEQVTVKTAICEK